MVPDLDGGWWLWLVAQAEAVAFSNRYAPEHLIVNTTDAEEWLPALDNAGSVFLGPWTPESVGDYASGTNHVLPTYGYGAHHRYVICIYSFSCRSASARFRASGTNPYCPLMDTVRITHSSTALECINIVSSLHVHSRLALLLP